ncbi:MAG: hypothetical protein RhofKO_20220 [Rhodothermales bacterium]
MPEPNATPRRPDDAASQATTIMRAERDRLSDFIIHVLREEVPAQILVPVSPRTQQS